MRRQLAICHTCELTHLCAPNSDEAIEFLARHMASKGHLTEVRRTVPAPLAKLSRMLGVDTFGRMVNGVLSAFKLGHAGYGHNASVKQAFGTATAFTITNANLAASVTAGWMSNAIDNSSNLYDDALIHTVLAAVNTAPAGSKAIFQYGFGLVDSSGALYTSTGDGTASGSEGTLTFPSITTLPVVAPLIGVIPYPVQNKAINGGPFSVAAAFNGILPVKWAIGMVNDSSMTLNVTSIKYQEVYYTVV